MCCSSFLKVMMFIFNGAIFLAGAAILGVGIWVTVDSGSFSDLLASVDKTSQLNQLFTVSYVLIAVGAVLVVIGFLGCCGAMKESKCMLLTFFSIVLIIFLIEVAGAVVLFVFQGFAEEIFLKVEGEAITAIKTDYGRNGHVTELWDSVMTKLKCCGFKNYTDFEGSPFEGVNNTFPSECCGQATASCNENAASTARVEGCFNKLLTLIEDNAMIIAGVALGIAFIEIAAMVVSMVLYCKAGKK